MDTQEIDPAALEIAQRYKLLIGGVVPRPIALVSTVDGQGRPNLAPFSFFNGVSSNPMTLLFCPANRPDGSPKDTLRNCQTVGQFVVNVASEAIVRRVACCAEELPHGESEFALSGLTPAPSTKVAPPRVAESPLSFECAVREIVQLNPGAPAGGNIVLGEVVWIHAAEGLVDERFRVDQQQLAAVGRMGGLGYCATRDRFELPMG
ncbi:MAG: flavin reductase family protein, partial [Planctomycetota bacterium]